MKNLELAFGHGIPLKAFITAILVMLLLLLHQCNRTSKLKVINQGLENKIERVKANVEAANDTIITYKNDNDYYINEISGYQYTIAELKGENKDLLKDYEKKPDKPDNPKNSKKDISDTEDFIKNLRLDLKSLESIDPDFNKYSVRDILEEGRFPEIEINRDDICITDKPPVKDLLSNFPNKFEEKRLRYSFIFFSSTWIVFNL